MTEGTIVLVHGTGVRLKNYRRSFDQAQERAASVGIEAKFCECAWGDPLGVVFPGMSLPDPPSDQRLREEEEDFARWSWLFDDPLFELDKLTIRDTSWPDQFAPPGQKPPWKELWDKIYAYRPLPEFALLLKRGGLGPFWGEAWAAVAQSGIAELAFERSAHELPEASNAFARAVVAELHVVAVSHVQAGPNRALRDALVLRLLNDWNQVVYARSGFFAKLFERAATRVLRRHRNEFTDSAVLPMGDILLYQSRGAEVREFIRDKVIKATPPVTIVAHSLGGIACFDLLALPDPPAVARFVTIGSQSPFFYEIGALVSLRPPQGLPSGFPPWLNMYDRNDFLSYVAERLFTGVKDHEVESGQAFPESHSAYFGSDEVWAAIREFSRK
jgi:hypothetical protein